MEQSKEAERRAAIESMSEEEAHHFLMDENEARVRRLFRQSGGAVDLETSFEFTKIAVYVTHICADLNILDRADLDFQGRKADMLDEIESQYDEAMREREAEVARRKLANAGFNVPGQIARISPEHPTMRVIRPEPDDLA